MGRVSNTKKGEGDVGKEGAIKKAQSQQKKRTFATDRKGEKAKQMKTPNRENSKHRGKGVSRPEG